MTSRSALVLTLIVQMTGAGVSLADSSHVVGNWKVEVIFENGQSRSLRFEAKASGKGSFQLLVPTPMQGGSTESSAAAWTQNEERYIAVSGPVQFPLGNVGLERGTLVLKGRLETDGSITGEAKFFPVGQDPTDPKAKPSKSGTFKAISDR